MPKQVVALEASFDTSQAEGSVKSLKAQLKEAQADVQKLSDKFGLTSVEAQNAAKKAADLKDRIGDAKSLTDAFNPDAKFKSFSSAIQGVVGGFSALQGAQALFGSESEDLQKVLVKVQSAMALSQGINSIMEAKDAFKILGAVIKTNVVGAFSTLKAAMISTGIGALIIGIGLLINYFSDMSDAADKAAESQKKLNEQTKKYADEGLKGEINYIERTQKLDIAKAKNAGKTEKEIFNIEQDWRNQKGRSLQRHYDEIKGVDAVAAAETLTQMKNLKAEIDASDLDFRTKQKEQQSAHNEKIKENNKANQKLSKSEQEEADKKAIADKKAFDEKVAEDLKQKEENRIAQDAHTEELIQEARLAAIQDGYTKQQQEIANNEQKAIDDELDRLSKGQITKEQYEINRTAIEALYGKQRADAAKANGEKMTAEEKKQAADQIKIDQEKADQKKAIQDAQFGALDAGVNFLKAIAGKNKALQKAAIIAENAMGIAKIITNTMAANAKALSYGPAAPAIITANNISAGFGVATTLAATAKALKAINSGGDTSAPPIGGGTTAPIAPEASSTTLNQMAINNAGNQAIKTYVVESDVSGNQERIDRIQRAARIGP
jgi:hypothetical protein